MGQVTVKVVDKESGILQVSNVRLGFKSLWGPNIVKGKDSERHTAQFLCKQSDKEAFEQVYAVAKYVFSKATDGKGKVPFNEGKVRNPSGSIKWNGERFGVFEDKSGENYFCFRTTNSKNYEPTYIDRKGRPVREADGFDYTKIEDKVIYAGCRVNVKIQYKVSNFKGEMMLWPNLVAIQFAGHDQPFGGMSEEKMLDGFGEVEASVNEETGFGEVEEESSELDIRNLM